MKQRNMFLLSFGIRCWCHFNVCITYAIHIYVTQHTHAPIVSNFVRQKNCVLQRTWIQSVLGDSIWVQSNIESPLSCTESRLNIESGCIEYRNSHRKKCLFRNEKKNSKRCRVTFFSILTITITVYESEKNSRQDQNKIDICFTLTLAYSSFGRYLYFVDFVIFFYCMYIYFYDLWAKNSSKSKQNKKISE